MLNDILKERGVDGIYKYSQGRVYLFISIVVFYATLITFVSLKAFSGNPEINLEFLNVVIDSVKYPMGIFAGYVLLGKYRPNGGGGGRPPYGGQQSPANPYNPYQPPPNPQQPYPYSTRARGDENKYNPNAGDENEDTTGKSEEELLQ